MSNKTSDQPSRLSSIAILPWMVALVLALVLVGSVTILGLGLTVHSQSELQMAPDNQPAMDAPPADKEPSPESTASPVLGEAVAEVAPEAAPTQMARSSADYPTIMPLVPNDAPEILLGQLDAEVGVLAVTAAPESDEETAAVPLSKPPAKLETITLAARTSSDIVLPVRDPDLGETSLQGPLSSMGLYGREPWKVYARSHNTDDARPKVAIILSGLGLSSAATEAAIQDLPSEVTLAYQPFAENIQQWIRLSRAAGHEVLLNLPMQPADFPAVDSEQRALFVSLSPEEKQDRMRWALSRVSGFVGVVNHMGGSFTTSQESMQPILVELKARGLLFVDAQSAELSVTTTLATAMEVARATNDLFLDNREVSRMAIDARLAAVERVAQEVGVSIAIGQAFPVTIERLRIWADTLNQKGIALVPITAVVDRQLDQ